MAAKLLEKGFIHEKIGKNINLQGLALQNKENIHFMISSP